VIRLVENNGYWRGRFVPGAQGARKVRWQIGGRGKRGGVRVVYFHLPVDGVVLLVLVYAKSQRQNVQPKDIHRSRDDD